MKKKDLLELRKKSLAELGNLAREKSMQIIKTKAEMLSGKEKNLKKVKNLKNELSKILTIAREKEIMERKG